MLLEKEEYSRTNVKLNKKLRVKLINPSGRANWKSGVMTNTEMNNHFNLY